MFIPVVVFLVVLAVVFGAFYTFVQKPEDEAKDTVMRRLEGKAARKKGKRVSLLRGDGDVTAFAPLDQAMTRVPGMARSLSTRLQHAGMEMTPGALLLICLVSGLVTLLLVGMMFGNPWIALSVALVATQVPIWFVRFKGTRRVRTFEEQFPEAIDLISRAMRAGHAFTTALSMVSDEAPQPVAGEFKRLYDEQNFGKPMPDAMRDFADRIPLLDAKFFVTAVLTQRESGGNLSEVLDNLARVIRERFRVKRQIRVISAHGRMTGGVLIALPPVMAMFFMAIVPDHFANLTRDPAGQNMIIGGIVLQVIGTLIIRKLIDIEY
jgi:tight adherence protein B